MTNRYFMGSSVISSYIPFPNIYWWLQVLQADKLLLDGGEHFEKMTYRNKYFIAGSNGGIQLSIPLVQGRQQRSPMQDVLIDNKQRWQVQHWRTLVSVYKRTPYFEHYEPILQPLYTTQHERLIDFNLASVMWLCKQLQAVCSISYTDTYKKDYPESTDMRHTIKPGVERTHLSSIMPYHQVFADRHGFLPNLSMLDLLFAEGPYAVRWMKENEVLIYEWKHHKETER
ncbi:hypothetical protein CAP35_14680 [Chitinophagaceae bacterium IBVUCB1]|nr:hypothetical protein CAP35_14680 [Chitinophagaceae bacterium IBVUCB1]